MIFVNLISSKWKIKLRKIVDQMRRMKILKKIRKQLNSLKFYYRKLSYNIVRAVYKIWNCYSIYSFWEKKFENFFFRWNILFIIKSLWMTEKVSIFKLYKNIKDLKQEFCKLIQSDMNTIEFNSIHQFKNKIKF